MVVFRLGSALVRAHDGMGAKLYGGRWNRKGTAVVYYVATPIEIPDDIAVTVIPISGLPAGWNASTPIDATRQIGTNWAGGLRTAVLSVPSAVVPQERNFLLNPAHPDFKRIRFFNAEPFYFDDRFGRTK